MLAVPPSVCSLSSSPVSSFGASSLFSTVSNSTAPSAPDGTALAQHQAQPPPALDPSAKAASIRLPAYLPAPPHAPEDVDLSALTVDDELEGAPVGFAVGKLRSVGSNLLNFCTATTLHIPPGPSLPQYLRCTFPPVAAPSPVYLPSHVLAIKAADSSRTLLLAAHGLLWASSSRALSLLSARPEKQGPHPSLPAVERPLPSASDPEGTAFLPVLELSIASSKAFPLLQGWVYLRSPSLLLSSLLPSPPSAPSSLSHLLNPSFASSVPSTPEALTQTLAAVSSRALLESVHLVHGLWSTAVALEVADDQFWRVLAFAWKVLVAALALRERQRRRMAATPTTSDDEE
ncbi:hypothetical protein JCM10213_006780 [Rhodosporidiobolus nylandii]